MMQRTNGQRDHTNNSPNKWRTRSSIIALVSCMSMFKMLKKTRAIIKATAITKLSIEFSDSLSVLTSIQTFLLKH